MYDIMNIFSVLLTRVPVFFFVFCLFSAMNPSESTNSSPQKLPGEEEGEESILCDRPSSSHSPSTEDDVENIDCSSLLTELSTDQSASRPTEPSSPDSELRRRRLERFESLNGKKADEDENKETKEEN